MGTATQGDNDTMPRPQVIYRGGRPRKAGPRESSGRLARNAPVLPPGMLEDGLALGPSDYREREVTERGQVIGRTMALVSPLDRLPIGNGRDDLDGDEWKALAEYQARHQACVVSVKSPLNNTPGSGAGLDGVVDWLRFAHARRDVLRAALSQPLWSHCEAVFDGAANPDVVKLKQAARCLIAALDGERRRA